MMYNDAWSNNKDGVEYKWPVYYYNTEDNCQYRIFTTFTIDFSTMQQTNEKTGTVRNLMFVSEGRMAN